MTPKPIIGVSSCLLGNAVRHDGGHRRSRIITDVLHGHMDLRPICPELGIGLGVPRQTIRLENINGQTRLVSSKDKSLDFTDEMVNFARLTGRQLENLAGFIFKKDSPSCGAFRVPVVVHKDGHRLRSGTGIFARQFMKTYPWVPVEEEGRLNDEQLRQNFLERVYALHRWNQIPNLDNNLTALIDFHASHKLMLMARNQIEYQNLGRWVAETTYETLKVRRQAYIEKFMLIMNKNASKGQHVNVLMHIMGYLKNKINKTDKLELLNSFESYRNCHLPLSAILLLLKHHLRNNPNPYLNRQQYLAPYPQEITI